MAAKASPELNIDEFKLYNKMAAGMDVFHSGFRATWDKIYTTGNHGLESTTPEAFVTMILDWCKNLDAHHSLEEEHVFPKLAVKMPVFARDEESTNSNSNESTTNETTSAGLGKIHEQHKQIHVGLDVLHEYVKRWLAAKEKQVNWEEIRALMDSFGAILWNHMDEEVEMLGATNMQRYWTLDEMKQLPFKVKD